MKYHLYQIRWTKMSDAEIEDILKKGDRDQNG